MLTKKEKVITIQSISKTSKVQEVISEYFSISLTIIFYFIPEISTRVLN